MRRRDQEDHRANQHGKDRGVGRPDAARKPSGRRAQKRQRGVDRDRLAEQLRKQFFVGSARGPDLIVMLAMQAEPDDAWSVERSMIDWEGVLVGEAKTDLSDGAKRAIVESVHAKPPDPEMTAQDLMDKTEKTVDFMSRVGPKAMDIINLFRGKAPEPKKEP